MEQSEISQGSVPTVQFPKQESGLIRDLEKAMLSNIKSEASMLSPAKTELPKASDVSGLENDKAQLDELNQLIADYKMRGSADADEARSLIQKLQFAVMNYQEQARSAKERNSLELKDLKEQLEAKNETIDAQRVLIQRYEFAVAEASVFLSRPLHEFQTACEIAGVNLAVDTSQIGDEAKVYEEDPTRARTALDLDLVKNFYHFVETDGTSASQRMSNGSKAFRLTDFEIKCMQSIRLAYLYTRVVQNIMAQVSTKGLSITKHLPRLNAEGSAEAPVNMSNHAKVIPSFGNAIGNASLILEAQDAQFAQVRHRDISEQVGVTLKSRQHVRQMSAGPKLGQDYAAAQREKLWNIPAVRSRTSTAESNMVDKRTTLQSAILARRLLEVDVTESGKYSSGSLQLPVLAADTLNSSKPEAQVLPLSATESGQVPPGQVAEVSASDGRCSNCHKLMLQLDRERDHLAALKKTVTEQEALAENAKAVAEKFRIENDMVNAQLEDLTGELFNQANILVADESRMRYALEKQTKELQLKIIEWKNRCARRETELKDQLLIADEARRRMFAAEYARAKILESYLDPALKDTVLRNPMLNPSFSQADGSPDATASIVSLFHAKFPSAINPKDGDKKTSPMGITSLAATNPTDGVLPVVFVDGVTLAEFQDHLRLLIKEGSNQPTVNHTSAFMKRCLVEDVEACLFSSSEPIEMRPSTLNNGSGSPGLSLFKSANNGSQLPMALKKKFIDAVSKGGCEIQSAQQRKAVQQSIMNAQNDSKSTAPLNKKKCMLCLTARDCDFKARFLNPPTEWNSCCRFCRDRIVSVCEFYGYLLQLKQAGITPDIAAQLAADQGQQVASSVGDLSGSSAKVSKAGIVIFRHVQWLRRRMAAARIGSNGLFDSEAVVKISTSSKCPVVIGSEANSKNVSSEWESWSNVIN